VPQTQSGVKVPKPIEPKTDSLLFSLTQPFIDLYYTSILQNFSY